MIEDTIVAHVNIYKKLTVKVYSKQCSSFVCFVLYRGIECSPSTFKCDALRNLSHMWVILYVHVEFLNRQSAFFASAFEVCA